MPREGELNWFLSVRYTHDKITGAIGCSQEAHIQHVLVKYGMEHANACKLPMNPVIQPLDERRVWTDSRHPSIQFRVELVLTIRSYLAEADFARATTTQSISCLPLSYSG